MENKDSPIEELISALAVARDETFVAKIELNKVITTSEIEIAQAKNELETAKEETATAKNELNKLITWSEGEYRRMNEEITQLKKELAESNVDLDMRIREIAREAVRAAVLATVTTTERPAVKQETLDTYSISLEPPSQKMFGKLLDRQAKAKLASVQHEIVKHKGVDIVETFPLFCFKR